MAEKQLTLYGAAEILGNKVLRKYVENRLDRRIQRRVGVDDVIQEVAIRSYGKPMKNGITSLLKIARECVIDHKRWASSGKRDFQKEVYQPVEKLQDFSDQLEIDEQVDLAWKMVDQLDEMSREVIVCRINGETNEDFSQRLGITEPAASMRYIRAVRKLRKML